MNRKNAETSKLSLRARAKSLASKLAAGASTAFFSAAAMAQTATDSPATLDGAAAFMQTKGGIAIAVAAAITLILLGITGAKLPRRGS